VSARRTHLKDKHIKGLISSDFEVWKLISKNYIVTLSYQLYLWTRSSINDNTNQVSMSQQSLWDFFLFVPLVLCKMLKLRRLWF